MLEIWRKHWGLENRESDGNMQDLLQPDVRTKFFAYIHQWHTAELDKVTVDLGDPANHDDLDDEEYQKMLNAKVNAFLELVVASMKGDVGK